MRACGKQPYACAERENLRSGAQRLTPLRRVRDFLCSVAANRISQSV
jgi:hypothetical protein